MLRLFINSCALFLLPLLPLPLLLLLQQQQLQQRRARRRRRIVRHIYGERRLVATGGPSCTRKIKFPRDVCECVAVLPEGVTPFLRCCSVVQCIHEVFFFARVLLQRTVKISLPHTNTGTCAAAATHTFTATTSSRSSSSLVSREAIKSSTKETNTLFFSSQQQLIPSSVPPVADPVVTSHFTHSSPVRTQF